MIGRELRPAERVIDVLKLNRALNRAKDDLEAAILAEMLRATRRWLRANRFWKPHLDLTPAIRKPLRDLERIGRDAAHRELARLGVRLNAAPNPDPRIGGLEEVLRTIRLALPQLSVRIVQDLVDADLSDASSAAVARALLRVPGARDIASRVVSTALMSGMSQTFEQADSEGLVAGWEYTAVLDSGTCEECAPLDGEQYPTWAAIQEVLPNGGPNPACLGEGRCRCRAVPVG